jgi:hypothetical protein
MFNKNVTNSHVAFQFLLTILNWATVSDPFRDNYSFNIMSYPKKAKDWRNLILDNQQFRWSFVAKDKNSLLKLQGSTSSGQQAIVTLPNWRDSWLSIGQSGFLPNEPKVVTSKLASQAIEFALQNGWKPEEAGSTINFVFKDGNFIQLK